MNVLFIAEAVTLAHVGRTKALADALHARGVAVQLALAGTDAEWATDYPQHRLPGIGSQAFMAALRDGRPVLQADVLEASVRADAALLQSLRPDLVIGDFRLSLSISARQAGVPYATLTNAYWSARCKLPMPMPVLPLSRLLPLPLARALFAVGRHAVVPLHCRPMNVVRRRFGMPSLGSDLRRVYSDADHVLFADLEGMFPMDDGAGPAPTPHFLGPVPWAPDMPDPIPWDRVDRSRPVVYVTVGSSGDPQVLRTIVRALADLGATVLAATAGSPALDDLQLPHVHMARYLPGDAMAAAAALVVCNGGSMGCQQALAADRPVLGVCANMDQFLNMAGIESAGAGLHLRADRVDAATLTRAVRALLDDPRPAEAAARMGRQIRAIDAGQRLFDLLPVLRRLP